MPLDQRLHEPPAGTRGKPLQAGTGRPGWMRSGAVDAGKDPTSPFEPALHVEGSTPCSTTAIRQIS